MCHCFYIRQKLPFNFYVELFIRNIKLIITTQANETFFMIRLHRRNEKNPNLWTD